MVNVPPGTVAAVGEHAQIFQHIATQYNLHLPSESGIRITPVLRDRLSGLFNDHVLFGGRERELAHLTDFVTTSRSGYLFLTGPSGYGKTALLVNWVRPLAGTGLGVCYQFTTHLYDADREDFALRNLCQQLLAYHDMRGELPSSTQMVHSLYSLLLKIPPDHGKRLVVVFDGLDEAKEWRASADLFPQPLPDGVFVIFSARQIADRDWRKDLKLPPDGPVMQLTSLGIAEIARLLEAAGSGAARWARDQTFLEAVYQKSRGDPFYLHFLVADIRDIPISSLEQLDEQPQGLQDYLAKWWEDIPADRSPAVGDLLGYLLVARARLSRDELTDISNADALTGAVFEGVIGLVRRYLIGNEVDGYGFCHQRFRDFVAERRIKGDEQQAYRDRLLTYCERWREHRSSYALGNYGDHLLEAGRQKDLLALLDNRAWYEAQDAVDPTGSNSLNTLDLIWKVATESDAQAVAAGHPAALLGTELRCALASASLHSLSENIEAELLEALVASRAWRPQQALAAARLNPDLSARSKALMAVSATLAEPERSTALAESLQAARYSEEGWQRREVFAELIPRLGADLVDEALAAARQVQDPGERAYELALVSQRLPPAARDAVIDEAFASAMEDESELIEGRFVTLLEVLPEAAKPRAFQAALDEARALPMDDESRSRQLAALAKHSDEESQEAVLAEALESATALSPSAASAKPGEIVWNAPRTLPLVDLAPQLKPTQLVQAVAAAQELANPKDRDSVLEALVPRLVEAGQVDLALRFAKEMTNSHQQSDALETSAQYLTSAEQVDELLGALLATGNDLDRGSVEAAVAVRLMTIGQSDKALQIARGIASEWFRVEAMAGAAAQVPGTISQALVGEVFTLAKTSPVQERLATSRGFTQVSELALIKLALRLIRDGQSAVGIAIARLFPDKTTAGEKGTRADALRVVGTSLSGPQQRKILKEAWAATRTVGDLRLRIRTIAQLLEDAPAEPADEVQGLITQALTLAEVLPEGGRLEAIGWLAPLVKGASVERALALARGLSVVQQRVEALADLAPHVPLPSRGKVLEEAVELARTVKWQARRSAGFLKLVPQLSPELQKSALAAAGGQLRMFIALAPRVIDICMAEVINTALAFENVEARAEALAAIGPWLPEELQRSALDAAKQIDDENTLERVLRRIIPGLSEPLLLEAVEVVKQVQDLDVWLTLAAAVAIRQAELGKVQDALETAAAIEWEHRARFDSEIRIPRVQALAGVLAFVPEEQRAVVLQSALDELQGIHDGQLKAEAVSELGRFMPSPRREEAARDALAGAVALPEGDERSDAIRRLAPQLPEPLLSFAFAAAANLPETIYLNKSPRADVFSQLSVRGATLGATAAYRFWSDTAYALARGTRPALLWDIPALSPLLLTICGPDGPLEAVRAIIHVAEQWP